MSQVTQYLKIADRNDLQVVLDLTRELYENSVYSTVCEFDEVYVKNVFLESLDLGKKEVCTVLLKEGEKTLGLITMGKTTLMFSSTDYMAVELAFWIRPQYRNFSALRKLLEAYFYWAKQTGCKAAFVGKLKSKNAPEQYIVRRV